MNVRDRSPGLIKPIARILTIGDELLKGTVLNGNARFLGAELLRLGFKVDAQASCPDDISLIKSETCRLISGCDVLILTGGLGPTPDDVTREALASHFKVPLHLSTRQMNFIQRYYRQRGRVMPAMVRKEAMFPKNSMPLFNRYGIALGFAIPLERCLVVVLPGVPSEMEKMFFELVEPLILDRYPDLKLPCSLIVKTAGIGEPEIMKRLGRDFFDEPVEFGIYPMMGEVTLRLYSESKNVIHRFEKKIRRRLARWTYAFRETSLAETVGKILIAGRQTLAVAESCTGGLLVSELTSVSGASAYLKGAVIAYSDLIKKEVLGIPALVLRRKGAVSEETARWMACRTRVIMNSSMGLGITGIAGPSGGTRGKPVGLVFIGISTENGVKVWRENFHGSRKQIQAKAAKKALEYMWITLRNP